MTTPLRHADIDDALPASGPQLANRSKTNALLKRIAFHAAAPAAVERSVQERLGDVVSIKDFGAKGEFASATDISTTADSTTVTAASPRWTEADAGKWIFIAGAGDYNGNTTLFRSTIAAFVSSTQVTVADAAVNTTTGAYAEWGSDDTAPFRAACAWCRDNGRELFLPGGVYTLDPAVMNTAIPINDNGRLVIRGAGPSTIIRRMGASMFMSSPRMMRFSSTSGGFQLFQISDLEIDGNNVQNPPPDGSTETFYEQAASLGVEAAASGESIIDTVITRNLILRRGMGDHLRVGVGESTLVVRVNLWMIENVVERERTNGRASAILQSSVAQVFASNMDSTSRAVQHEFNHQPVDREVFHFYDNVRMYRWKMSSGSRCVNAVANQVRVTGYLSIVSVKRARFINCDIFPHSSGDAGSPDPEDSATSTPMIGNIEFIGCTIRARIDVRWLGPWVDDAYDERDGVSHNEAAWVAVAPVSAGQEPGVHANWEEISPSNTSAFGMKISWSTGNDGDIKFTRCRFLIEAPAVVGNVAGYAIDENTAVGDTNPNLRRITFEECEFDPRFQRSIFGRRHGDYITKRCRLVGWEEGIRIRASSERRQSWTSIDDDFSGAAVPFHARNTSGLVRLDLRHSGMPFAQAAWASDGWSDDAGHVSTRLLWLDATDLVGGSPVGGGIAGDRARLRKPVAGAVAEWICTSSHPTAATWKALTSAAA